jgi:hypothetical protein
METFLYHNPFNLERFDQLCAFNLYKSHGFDTACSVYPEHREFILAHMEQSLEEVRRESYKAMEKKAEHT